MKAWKISGWYLFAMGIVHVLFGIVQFRDELADILKAGIINSVSDQMDLNAAFWFIFTGFLLIYMGLQWQKQIDRNNEPLSLNTALGMTAITVAGVLIVPMSGFWLLLPLCIIMLHSAYTLEHSG